MKPLEEYDARFRPILLQLDMEAQMQAAMAEAGGVQARGVKELRAAETKKNTPAGFGKMFKSVVQDAMSAPR